METKSKVYCSSPIRETGWARPKTIGSMLTTNLASLWVDDIYRGTVIHSNCVSTYEGTASLTLWIIIVLELKMKGQCSFISFCCQLQRGHPCMSSIWIFRLGELYLLQLLQSYFGNKSISPRILLMLWSKCCSSSRVDDILPREKQKKNDIRK